MEAGAVAVPVCGDFDRFCDRRVLRGRASRQVRSVKAHSEKVHAVAFSPDGTRVVSGSQDNLVKIWDAETLSEV